jgi:hypothetical protein
MRLVASAQGIALPHLIMLCCAFNPSGWDQMTAFIGRRKFIALLGGLVAPTRATAQHALPRIGILSPEALPPGLLREFERGLRDLGYVPKQNIAFEIRNAEGVSHRLAALADELVRLQVDVILAVNTPAPLAVRAQQPERMQLVGFLMGSPDNAEARSGNSVLASFTRTGLDRRSHRSGRPPLGRSLAGTHRGTGTRELVQVKPDVIFAGPTNALIPLQRRRAPSRSCS